MRSTLVWFTAASMLRVCGTKTDPAATAANPNVAAGVVPALAPEHGGSVATSAGVVSEVSALPDGRLVTYLRDPQQAPLAAADLQVSLRKPDGQLQPVPMAYDPSMQAYVGRPAGVEPGSYPVQVSVQPTNTAPPVQLVTPPVAVAQTAPLPQPRYGGRVEIVGNHAVEMVTTPTGDVALFWMDLNGNPIPARDVTAPTVVVNVNGRRHTLTTHVEGDRLIARLPGPPSPNLTIFVPRPVVRGVQYQTFAMPPSPPPIIAALPPVVTPVEPSAELPPIQAGLALAPPPLPGATVAVNAPPMPVGVIPPTPQVVALPPPPAPGVLLNPSPPPGVILNAPRPNVVVAAPSPGYVVAPPSPGVVVATPPPVIVQPPSPGVVVGPPGVVYEEPGHVPRGNAWGYWRNHGEVVGGPPGVVVGAPSPGVVVGGPPPGIVVGGPGVVVGAPGPGVVVGGPGVVVGGPPPGVYVGGPGDDDRGHEDHGRHGGEGPEEHGGGGGGGGHGRH